MNTYSVHSWAERDSEDGEAPIQSPPDLAIQLRGVTR
ncbi:terminase gpP N-terminus-related DNA-binding protein [Vibrio navarrensis]